MRRFFCFGVAAVILLVVTTPLTSHALDVNWFGGTGSWNDPLNWSPNGVPEGHVDAVVTNAPNSSATVFSNSDTPVFGGVNLFGTNGETMTLSLQAGTIFAVSGLNEVGNGGIVNQTGGDFLSAASYLIIDQGGIYNLSGGMIRTQGNGLVVQGVMNQTGGIVQCCDRVEVSQGGIYNLSGTGQVEKDYLFVTGGVFNQNGGTVTIGSFAFITGGTYNLTAGNLNLNVRSLGLVNGSGTVNQSGGVFTGSSLCIGCDLNGPDGTRGTYNLSGGTLTQTNISNYDTIHYSGGEMHLGPDGAGTLTNNGTIDLSGIGVRFIDGNIINNGTFNTINTTAVYTGAFTNSVGATLNNYGRMLSGLEGTLTNAGTLINAGSIDVPTYTQTTGQTINNGTLTASVEVQGGLLSGTGTINGDVTIGSGATVSPGNSPGMLTINGNLSSSGNMLFQIGGLASGLYDVLKVNGSALFTGGHITFDFINGFVASAGKSWDFLYASAITGWDTLTFNVNGLRPGQTYAFNYANGVETLTVREAHNVPEPDSFLLLAISLVGLAWWRWKRAA